MTAPIYLNPPKGGWPAGEGPPALDSLPAASIQRPAASNQKRAAAAQGGHRFAGLSKGRIAERGKMNQTEKAYAGLLAQRVLDGEVAKWWFEPFSLRLSRPATGQPARLTIDFMILMPDGVTYLDDAKGTGVDNDAQRVAMKCAAEQYPLWIFRIVKRQTKAQGGGWKVTQL